MPLSQTEPLAANDAGWAAGASPVGYSVYSGVEGFIQPSAVGVFVIFGQTQINLHLFNTVLVKRN